MIQFLSQLNSIVSIISNSNEILTQEMNQICDDIGKTPKKFEFKYFCNEILVFAHRRKESSTHTTTLTINTQHTTTSTRHLTNCQAGEWERNPKKYIAFHVLA